jgi:hypothetical protein
MPWDGGPYTPIDVLWHNGEGSACNAIAVHVISSLGSTTPSLSLGLAVNTNPGDAGLFGTEAMELVSVLREIEERQLWPQGDIGGS